MAHTVRFLAALVVLASASCAHAQNSADAAESIARSLNTPESQWVFNHLCVPDKLLAGKGYTQGDFAGAYMAVTRARWQLALDALAREDNDASMNQLARVLHGVIDAYWPGRVVRNGAGAITKFGSCEKLGELKGILREEGSGRGPDARTQEAVTRLVADVIRKWKDRKPFDEVAPLLSGGPMKLSDGAAALPLGGAD